MSATRAHPISAWSACAGIGRNVPEMTASLREGRRGLSPCPLPVRFETVCGVVADPLPELPRELRHRTSRTVQIALLAAEEIAGPVAAACRRHGADRVAVVVSTSTGGIGETEAACFHFHERGELPANYDYMARHSFGVVADVVADVTGARGPRYVVSTACSSGAKVFASARRLIEGDLADAVLVGGADALCYTTVCGFHSLGVLSPVPCRPFSADRPGMNIGEGAAFALVERDGDARAWLLAEGESSDAFHMSAPHPEGRGALAAMKAALEQAGVEPAAVDYINAHGTGTVANDDAESHAVRELFGDRVPIASTKSMTGHTLGAAGTIEAVICLIALQEGFLPALAEEPLLPDAGVRVLTRPVAARPRTVLSNSFAFGGSNASLLFGGPR